jgi:cell division protein ZapA (FtsZ GTPase activity inhibitor)
MNELKTITIDGTEYNVADLNEQQKVYLAQITDINQRLGTLQFQADQLIMAKDGFVGVLKASLTTPAA